MIYVANALLVVTCEISYANQTKKRVIYSELGIISERTDVISESNKAQYCSDYEQGLICCYMIWDFFRN